MLSPGTYHLLLPKEPAKLAALRVAVLARYKADPEFARGMWRMCQADIFLWIDLFVWQFNPLKDGAEIGAFVLRPFQAEILRTLLDAKEAGDDVVIEKSREMGGTYLCLLLLLWFAIFHTNKKLLVISRNEEAACSRADPLSVFWKIECVLKYLPDSMVGEVKRHKKSFRFVRTNSYVTGTASTHAAGVGDRAAMIFLDEFSQVEDDKEMRQGTANTSDFRVFNGTHLGTDKEFYNLCAHSPEIKKVQMHWSMDPDKAKGLYQYDPLRPSVPVLLDAGFSFPPDYPFVLDGSPTGGPRPGVRSPWYDKKAAKIGSTHGVAMDLDINPTGSVDQFFDAIVIRRLVDAARPPLWRGDLRYDRDSGVPSGLVESPDGIVHLWTVPDLSGRVAPAPYGAGTDLGEGVGATASTLSIFDGRTGTKVCQVEVFDMDIHRFAALAVALCRWFCDTEGRPALLCWEKSGSLASHFKKDLADLDFWRIYYHTTAEATVAVVSDIPGFYPTPQAKGQLLRDYKFGLRDGECVNYSEKSLRQTLAFTVNPKGEPLHPSDRTHGSGVRARDHGELVIADALGWMMVRKLDARRVAEKSEKELERDPPYGSIAYRRKQREMVAAEEPLELYWSE
jgi:hypothetical protein